MAAKSIFVLSVLLISLINAHGNHLASIEDSIEETIYADANAARQKLDGAKQRGVNFKPMTCKIKRNEKTKFLGTVVNVANAVDTLDMCVAICWQFRFKQQRCQSVNFFAQTKKCELMEDRLDASNPDMFKYFVRADEVTYAAPTSCQEQGAPKARAPNPAPTPGTGNAIKPGSCGQTAVEPRVSRAVFENSQRYGFQRIVGGMEAKPHSFPWIVSMQWQGKHMCGGSLIRSNASDQTDLVVTAAHCLIHGFPAKDLEIIIGAHSFIRPETGEQRIRVKNYILHEQYTKRTMAPDIAVIKLEKPVKFTDSIQPVCLPSPGEQVPDNTPGIVAGWGFLAEGSGQSSKFLMQLFVPTVAHKTCKANYDGDYVIDQNAMLCAGYARGGKDACQGDSGGPFVFKNSQNSYVLQGVVSFGDGCAVAGKPGVYARVSSYIDWINKTIIKI